MQRWNSSDKKLKTKKEKKQPNHGNGRKNFNVNDEVAMAWMGFSKYQINQHQMVGANLNNIGDGDFNWVF